jgi:hypothetical protein
MEQLIQSGVNAKIDRLCHRKKEAMICWFCEHAEALATRAIVPPPVVQGTANVPQPKPEPNPAWESDFMNLSDTDFLLDPDLTDNVY